MFLEQQKVMEKRLRSEVTKCHDALVRRFEIAAGMSEVCDRLHCQDLRISEKSAQT